jgi:hypothetical protein
MYTKVLKEKQFLEPRSVMHVLDDSVESLVICKGPWLHAVLQWIMEVGEREQRKLLFENLRMLSMNTWEKLPSAVVIPFLSILQTAP